MRKISLTVFAVAGAAIATATFAAANRVTTETKGDERCILSNGIPDHETGQFPNSGNPNRISEQDVTFCVTRTPEKGTTAKVARTVGIAKNGIIIRPGTADWYDASSPRGHSRDRSSGWNLEGVGSGQLAVDFQNAHAGPQGDYHYHAMPDALKGSASETFVGYAADGFEIHYAGASAVSSWQLKSGSRPTAPFGSYDGAYNQDFEFKAGSGNLDQCNGATVNGKHMYFATDSYPFFPRCLYGTDITQYGGDGEMRGANRERGPRLFGGLFAKRDR